MGRQQNITELFVPHQQPTSTLNSVSGDSAQHRHGARACVLSIRHSIRPGLGKATLQGSGAILNKRLRPSLPKKTFASTFASTTMPRLKGGKDENCAGESYSRGNFVSACFHAGSLPLPLAPSSSCVSLLVTLTWLSKCAAKRNAAAQGSGVGWRSQDSRATSAAAWGLPCEPRQEHRTSGCSSRTARSGARRSCRSRPYRSTNCAASGPRPALPARAWE